MSILQSGRGARTDAMAGDRTAVRTGEARGREAAALKAVATGDRTAFEWLFRRYHDRVQCFVRRMIDRPDLVDEVVNDTLFAVWCSAGAFAGRSSVSTWIFGIACRRALAGIDGRGRHERLSDGDERLGELGESSPGGDPESLAVADSHVDALERALSTLGTERRAVVELTALGHSQKEIASAIDCPVGTVKTRLFHARRQLRKHEALAGVVETRG